MLDEYGGDREGGRGCGEQVARQNGHVRVVEGALDDELDGVREDVLECDRMEDELRHQLFVIVTMKKSCSCCLRWWRRHKTR